MGDYRIVLVSLSLAMLGAPALADDDPLFRSVPIASTAGFELGRGYDILTGTPRADCIERETIEPHNNLGADSIVFHSTKIENSSELDRSLGLTASASINYGSFGGGASASFSNSLSIDSYSLHYLVDASVSSKGASIRDARLKEKYVKLIQSGNRDALARFRTICGDGFIAEFIVGGGFQSLITIHTKSKSEKESLAASMNASFSVASGSASFSSAISNASETNQVAIRSFQKGGGGVIPLSPEGIAKKIETLPDAVAEAPSPIEAVVFSYILLLDDPTLPLIDLSEREVALSYLSELSATARDQQADAEYILENPSEFYSSPQDIPLLALEIKSLREYREAIKQRAESCVKSSGYCESLEMEIPTPQVRPARR